MSGKVWESKHHTQLKDNNVLWSYNKTTDIVEHRIDREDQRQKRQEKTKNMMLDDLRWWHGGILIQNTRGCEHLHHLVIHDDDSVRCPWQTSMKIVLLLKFMRQCRFLAIHHYFWEFVDPLTFGTSPSSQFSLKHWHQQASTFKICLWWAI